MEGAEISTFPNFDIEGTSDIISIDLPHQENIEQASLQVNSLLFPIMGAIAVILALQISIIARRR